MSQEFLQTMIMQTFWGVIEVYYGIVQVVNIHTSIHRSYKLFREPPCCKLGPTRKKLHIFVKLYQTSEEPVSCLQGQVDILAG